MRTVSRAALVVVVLAVFSGYIVVHLLFLDTHRDVYRTTMRIPEIPVPARPIPTTLNTRNNRHNHHPTFSPDAKISLDGPDPNHLYGVQSNPPYAFIIGCGVATAMALFILVHLVSLWFTLKLSHGVCHAAVTLAQDVCMWFCGAKQTRTTAVNRVERHALELKELEEDAQYEAQPSHTKTKILWYSLVGLFSVLVGLVVTTLVGSHYEGVCSYNREYYAHTCDLGALLLSEFRKEFGSKVGNATVDPTSGAVLSPPLIWIINGMMIARARNQTHTNFVIYNDHDVDFCYDHTLVSMAEVKGFLRRFGHYYEFFEKDADAASNPDGKFRVFPRSLDTLKGHSGPLSVDIDPCGHAKPPHTIDMPSCNGHMMPFRSDMHSALDAEFGKDRWKVPRDVNHYGLCAIVPWL